MRAVAKLALSSLLATGCAGAETRAVSRGHVDARAFRPAPGAEDALPAPFIARPLMPVGIMERPVVFRRHTFDPAALARPRQIAPSVLNDGGWVTIHGTEQRYFSKLGRPLVGEIEVATQPPYRAYTGGAEPTSFMRGQPKGPPCGPSETESLRARWTGILATRWTERELEIESYEGTFDKRTCRARADRGETVRATAVVPGILYAFRRCGAFCRPGDFEPAEDEVVFIAPPAEWVSSPSAPDEQAAPHVGTLTVVSVPLRAGRAASVALVFDLENIDFFEALRPSAGARFSGPELSSRGLAMRADVTWGSEEAQPSGVVFLSSIDELPGAPAR